MADSKPQDTSVDKIREKLADLRVRIAELRSGIGAMIKESELERDRLRKFREDRASPMKNPHS